MREEEADVSEYGRAGQGGIVTGARVVAPADLDDRAKGRYGVFYTAVHQGMGFTGDAWVDGLQQNEENRSNLTLIDHDQLRHDPLMALVSDQGNRGDSPPMAGKSTLNRLDHDPDGPAGPPGGTVGFNYRDG